jgi:hypothetical protein
LLLFVTIRPAHAHALGANGKLRDGKIEVEAYYDDDTPARNATVRLFDSDRREVATGRTDTKGVWLGPQLKPGLYEVVVDAGAGHRCTQKITVPALASSPEPTEPIEPAAPLLSDGPTREEFTRFPWLKLGMGVGLIAAVGVALVGLARRRKAAN